MCHIKCILKSWNIVWFIDIHVIDVYDAYWSAQTNLASVSIVTVAGLINIDVSFFVICTIEATIGIASYGIALK